LHHQEVGILLQKEKSIINKLIQNIMAYVISEDCIACGTCIDECPSGAISEGDIYSIDPDACTECGTCADVCPNEAISLP
jgi:ferredoxin